MTARELLESISVIIAVDGKLADEEKQYLFSVAKQLGVSKGDLNSVFDKVREGRGVVANPKSAKDQADLYAHLVTAAASDGEISTKERRILNDVGEHFGISVPPSRHGGGGVDHAELILQTDPQGGRGTTAASADTHRASGSALSHFFWAASVSLIALGSIGAVLFYKYVPSPRAGSEAAADAAGTFYDDLKGGLKNGLSAVGTMLQTKETTIHNAVMLAWSSEPELIVGKGLISVTSEGKQDRLVWGFDTNVVVNVSDIQVQYIIPLGNLPELEVKPKEELLTLYIPRPVLDTDKIVIPDSSDPTKWFTKEEGWIGSPEMLEKLRKGVRNFAIEKASDVNAQDYQEALKHGRNAVRQLIEPALKGLVPGAKLEVEYQAALPPVTKKEKESERK